MSPCPLCPSYPFASAACLSYSMHLNPHQVCCQRPASECLNLDCLRTSSLGRMSEERYLFGVKRSGSVVFADRPCQLCSYTLVEASCLHHPRNCVHHHDQQADGHRRHLLVERQRPAYVPFPFLARRQRPEVVLEWITAQRQCNLPALELGQV